MLDPKTINIIALVITFVLLIGAIKYKICLPSAYLIIIVTKPGLYFPFLAAIRFELIIAIFSVILILMSKGARERLLIGRSKTIRYMFLYLVVLYFSFIQAFDIAASWNRIYTWILPNVILVLQLLVFCRDKKDVKFFLWTFGILTAWMGYEPVYRFLVSGDIITTYGIEYSVAEKGIASGHVSLAHYLVQGMPFLWYLSFSCKNTWSKGLGLSLFVFCLSAVAISGARGGMVGISIMFFLIAMFSNRPVLMMILSFITIIVILIIMGERYSAHMRSILEFGSSDFSARSRLQGLVSGIELLIKRPILGVGPGCFPLARKAWLGWSLWSHNHYGQLAGELGMLGIIVWTLFAKQYISSCWDMRKSQAFDKSFKAITTAILVASGIRLALGMFDHSLHKFIWYMLAAISVVLEGLVVENKSNNSDYENMQVLLIS